MRALLSDSGIQLLRRFEIGSPRNLHFRPETGPGQYKTLKKLASAVWERTHHGYIGLALCLGKLRAELIDFLQELIDFPYCCRVFRLSNLSFRRAAKHLARS